MEQEEISIKKSSVNYGLTLGAILGITTTLIYVVSIEMLTKWWLGIILFFIAIAVGIVSVAKSKDILGGFISFKEAFTSYFITIAIGLLINVIVGILIFVVIDPDAAVFLQEQIIEIARSMMESFGAPEEEINKAIAEMESTNNYSLGSQIQAYVTQLAIYSVFGLLIALIMKKKDPSFE
ncbi:MAG: DUF4199 domain-containing protein [Flavobacteriaceae bacterium]|nr:DUF4199 domain-containing protein [Flavobacteriaceae bacterium]